MAGINRGCALVGPSDAAVTTAIAARVKKLSLNLNAGMKLALSSGELLKLLGYSSSSGAENEKGAP